MNIGQSHITISSSTRSLQRCVMSWFLTYPCTRANPISSCMGHLSSALGPSSSSALLLNGGPWVLTFQDGYKAVLQLLISSPRETSLPHRESSCLWHSYFQPVKLHLWIVWILFFVDQH